MTTVGIINSLASLAAALGLFFVAWQTREATKARKLEAFVEISRDLGSDESRELREFIYNELPQNPTEFSKDTLAKVESLCASFERTSLLVNSGLADKELLLRMYGEAIAKSWDKLSPYIESARPGCSEQYMVEFETLAKDARKYQGKHQRRESLS
jgi:hypothetical protein